MSSAEGLCVEGLTCGYGESTVIREVSLHVAPGEVAVLLGANGAGKTTTLMALSGLADVTAGSIRVDGVALRDVRASKRASYGLVHVPESRGLFFDLTVEQNLRIAASRGDKSLTGAVLEWMPELKPLLNRRCGLLSGGEQQMVAIARAVQRSPKVLVVDEMSLGLAPGLVSRLLPKLTQRARDSGIALLLVEQHVHLALAHSDRAYVMSRGRIVLERPSAELANDKDLIRASYLGGEFGRRPDTSPDPDIHADIKLEPVIANSTKGRS